MSARQSKRLKVAAEKALEVVSTTAASPAKARSSKRKGVVAQTATVAVESPPSPVATAAVVTSKSVEETKAEGASAAKDAWGALFAKKSARSGRVSPKPATPVTPETQAKIDGYASFDGLTSRGAATKLKIAAWNVNGLRALLKKEESIHMRAYLAQEDADVVCLSETKIDRDELQKLENLWSQYEFQYWSCATKKGYSGTAIFSKTKPLSVKDEIIVEGKKADDEGRFLALEYDKYWLVHTYANPYWILLMQVPNAGQKLERLDFRTKKWDAAMLAMLQDLEKTKPVVWCGDLNVAHQEIDIHDPKSNRNKSPGFTDAERESFGTILSAGFVDTFRHLHPEEQQFSYFSYRFNARAKNKGWRLDYFVVSQALLGKVEASAIRSSVTGSDHVPIVLELQEL
ncbi:Exodeoxyribonuclease iii, partial [Globisporangium splendens]